MTTIYTIGFTSKSAKKFFDLLDGSRVITIVDTRINNTSQLAGFAKGADLAFFARRVSDIAYEHRTDLAPTKELLDNYRKKRISWQDYQQEYINLLDTRKIKAKIIVEALHQSCLLCSEHSPDRCHRRLLAEYLQQANSGVEIVHLT